MFQLNTLDKNAFRNSGYKLQYNNSPINSATVGELADATSLDIFLNIFFVTK